MQWEAKHLPTRFGASLHCALFFAHAESEVCVLFLQSLVERGSEVRGLVAKAYICVGDFYVYVVRIRARLLLSIVCTFGSS